MISFIQLLVAEALRDKAVVRRQTGMLAIYYHRYELNMSEGYKPGDRVPKSGVYKVIHGKHSQPHEVTCVVGNTFPPCNKCQYPQFLLLKATIHIDNHEHFKKQNDAIFAKTGVWVIPDYAEM